MTVTDAQRRVYEQFMPAADHETARMAEWLLVHLLPGESSECALRRRAALEGPRRRDRHARDMAALEFYRSHLALIGGRYDDNLHDDYWSERHPCRAYRIRSLRPTDGCWWATGAGVLVVQVATDDALFAPADGWAIPAHDADGWGAMVFAARDASNTENPA